MNRQRLEELFDRWTHGSLSDAEETELLRLWLDPALEVKRTELLDALYDRLPDNKDMTPDEADLIFREILTSQPSIRSLPRKTHIPAWRRITVAASIILLAGLGGLSLLYKDRKTIPHQISQMQDIKPPATNHARITLANGQTVYLDSSANGSLAMQANVQLVKQADGQIAYKGTANEAVYNTLTNPRGSKVIDLMFSDGSRIWLNAGSSVTYPVAFTGTERKVEIKGEAYFEVSGNPSTPFKVASGVTEVQVLGTRFNINAYMDEPDIKVTLLEGAVKVGNNQGAIQIKPGEQAMILPNLPPRTTINADLEQVMAWKNGLFGFEGADLKTIMRQLARWYDIEVRYEGVVTNRVFKGEITRDLSLSQLMNGLQELGIKFRIEERTLIVIQE